MRILVSLVPALLLGCIAQTGGPNDTSSSAESLSVGTEQQQQAQPSQATARARLGTENTVARDNQNGENALTAPEGLVNTAGGGDPSQDDGDGKEPDPHPWQPHTAAALTRQSH
jgi:hypothetical protein